MLKQVEIYTDGACSGNPGSGGWACILNYNGIEKELSGGEELTTNNRMELTAIVKGLEALKQKCSVSVYSDSQYVVSAFNEGWIYNWIKQGWKTADKKEVKNVDLWQKLLELKDKHEVTFCKVKGHANDDKNNRCDKLAREQSEKFSNLKID